MTASLRGIRVDFGKKSALNEFSAQFDTGITALLGANGAGKSTLLRVMATVQRPTQGNYLLDEEDVFTGPNIRQIRKRIGWLPQTFGYEPNSRVSDFVSYLAWLRGIPKANLAARSSEALQAVGLQERSKSKMKTLSGGMVRRVGIAQAVVARPDLVLLDEPASGLDPVQRVELAGIIKQIARDNCVVLSTHLVEDAISVADRIIILSAGSVIWTGTPQELIIVAGESTTTDYVAALMRGTLAD